MLERDSQIMRLQDRVLKQMMKDTEREHEDVKNTVISRETNMKQFVRETMARIDESNARFADIELMFQIFFCRYYDNFEIFLEELLADIGRRQPALLDWVKLRKADDGLSDGEKLERRIEKVARLPLAALVETVAEEMSLDLIPDDQVKQRLILFSDVRNLLTHRNGRADRHFLEKHPTCSLQPGDAFPVTMEFTRDALGVMSKAATIIQARATAHFKHRYETVMVGENAWWEENDTRLPDLPPFARG
jgi:hypothetical protein